MHRNRSKKYRGQHLCAAVGCTNTNEKWHPLCSSHAAHWGPFDFQSLWGKPIGYQHYMEMFVTWLASKGW